MTTATDVQVISSMPHALEVARRGLPTRIRAVGTVGQNPGVTWCQLIFPSRRREPLFEQISVAFDEQISTAFPAGGDVIVSGHLDLSDRGELCLRAESARSAPGLDGSFGRWRRQQREQARGLPKCRADVARSASLDDVIRARGSKKLDWVGKETLTTFRDIHRNDEGVKRAFVARGLRVQGENVVPDLVGYLDRVDPKETAVVILGRGGGSESNLAPFEDVRLLRAISTCRVPVVAVVGHQGDGAPLESVATWHRGVPGQLAATLKTAVRNQPSYAEQQVAYATRDMKQRLVKAERRAHSVESNLADARERAAASERQYRETQALLRQAKGEAAILMDKLNHHLVVRRPDELITMHRARVRFTHHMIALGLVLASALLLVTSVAVRQGGPSRAGLVVAVALGIAAICLWRAPRLLGQPPLLWTPHIPDHDLGPGGPLGRAHTVWGYNRVAAAIVTGQPGKLQQWWQQVRSGRTRG